jgi:hypothetical protein
MMASGNLAKLQAELGHSDIQTTQRYAKLAPDYRTARDRGLIKLPKVAESFSDGIGSKLVTSASQRSGESAVRN